MITYPDECKGRFEQNETTIWTAKTDDMDITFIENQYDPNPKDNTFEKSLVYLIRKKGKLRIEHDSHVCGLFELEAWRKLLVKAGFRFREKKAGVAANDHPVFSCVKPNGKKIKRHR